MSLKSERPDTHCCQFRTKKKFAYFYLSTSHPFERGTTKYCHWTWSIVYHQRNKLKVYNSLKGNKLACLQIPKAHFSYLIWLICGKIIIYAIFIMVMDTCTKILSKQGIQNKLFTKISNSFIPWLLYLHVYL